MSNNKEQNQQRTRDRRGRGRPSATTTRTLRLIIDVETRWNSKIHMAERMISIQLNAIYAMQDYQVKKEMKNSAVASPNTGQWEVIKSVVTILKPFADQVTKRSGQWYVTLSRSS